MAEYCSGVLTVNFERISLIALVPLLVTLNMFLITWVLVEVFLNNYYRLRLKNRQPLTEI